MQISGADFKAKLTAGSIQIGAGLAINATLFEQDAQFRNSTMDGLVDATDTAFRGALDLVDSRIAGNLFLGGLQGANGIDLSGTRTVGYVTLAGAASKGAMIASLAACCLASRSTMNFRLLLRPRPQASADWQVFVFSASVVIGWVLGLFLVASMTG